MFAVEKWKPLNIMGSSEEGTYKNKSEDALVIVDDNEKIQWNTKT